MSDDHNASADNNKQNDRANRFKIRTTIVGFILAGYLAVPIIYALVINIIPVSYIDSFSSFFSSWAKTWEHLVMTVIGFYFAAKIYGNGKNTDK